MSPLLIASRCFVSSMIEHMVSALIVYVQVPSEANRGKPIGTAGRIPQMGNDMSRISTLRIRLHRSDRLGITALKAVLLGGEPQGHDIGLTGPFVGGHHIQPVLVHGSKRSLEQTSVLSNNLTEPCFRVRSGFWVSMDEN